MPKFGSHEIAGRGCFADNVRVARSRHLQRYRPNYGADPEPEREPGCAAPGAHEKDRGAKREDRHALARNSQAATGDRESPPRRDDWRRGAVQFGVDIDNLGIDRDAGTVRESREWK